MKMSRWFIIMGGLLVLFCISVVFAGDEINLKKERKKTFTTARDQRSKLLNSEIPRLEREISELKNKKAKLAIEKERREDYEEKIKNIDRDIRDINDKRNKEASMANKKILDDKFNKLMDYKNFISQSLENIKKRIEKAVEDEKAINSELDIKLKSLDKARADVLESEETISSLLNIERPQQDFKLYMSAIFALLVACVIVGFFVIAWKDIQVRQAIFSGHAGIQFVTLFSLVIAIILFGIIEILEGKELAALLGGLSGYILGRATSERKEQTPSGQPGAGQQNQPTNKP